MTTQQEIELKKLRDKYQAALERVLQDQEEIRDLLEDY